MPYLVHTDKDRSEMLETLGASSISELFAEVPRSLLTGSFDLPDGQSELEVTRRLEELAGSNRIYPDRLCFRGAGVYRRFIPAAVAAVTSKPDFYSAYTPYQAEASQGTLEAIFEFQTMISELTGLAVANASMYDGATALAEAAVMACASTGRSRVLVAGWLHPEYLEVLKTYAQGRGFHVEHQVPAGGRSLPGEIAQRASDQIAAVVYQQPNFLGAVEDADAICQAAHACGALAVAVVDPISLALLQPPAACGADVAVGEGQQLGMHASFGGPHVGFLACSADLKRRIPGRLVGQAHDAQGRRGFTLTLQAREQHIRRARATSNICTNHSLCALAATAYLSYLGPQGLESVAQASLAAAHQLQRRLCALPGWSPLHDTPFLWEFVVNCPDPSALSRRLSDHGILGGMALERWYPELDHALLFCCTEVNDQGAIDRILEVLT